MTREELLKLVEPLESHVRAEFETSMRTQSDADHEAFRAAIMARIAALTGSRDRIDGLVGKLAMISLAKVMTAQK